MVVLHVVAPGAVGGLERVVQFLAAGHRERGLDVHVAAVVPGSEPADDFFRPLSDAGVAVHRVAVDGRSYRRERRGVAALCRRLAPDLVHTHGYRSDVVDAGVARELGIPTATTVHGFTGGGWKNRLYERLQRSAFGLFDAVVAVSRPLAAQLRWTGLAADRLHVIPNAWRPAGPPLDVAVARRALGVPDDVFHVGWVGRLSAEKGPDVFVDALATLADLPVVASVLGDGRERAALEERAARAGVAGRIRWHDTVPEAGRLFSAFDAFVLSSRTEGTPIVLLEAMAAATPIVATAVGGVPDVVSEREARLVPPDDPAALARAIRAIHDERDAATVCARRGRERLDAAFAPDPWLSAYEAVYHGVVRAAREVLWA